MTKFNEFELDKRILKGISKAGFTECLPVQKKTFSKILKNKKDVCVQSQTGTGKTAAFLIPIFQLLLTDTFFKNRKALVIAPTRELADQIENEASLLGSDIDLKIGCFFGGVGYTHQEKILDEGVDIIIGTPGRLIDFSQQKKLNFSKIGILVIDEADRLFDMGFLPDIRRMLKKMPPPPERRTMLFSATLDYRIKELAWEYMNEPVDIEITPEQLTVENVVQELYHVERREKMALLLGILKKEQPANALIFTNTKQMAYEVSRRLSQNGYDCRFIMGDLPQKKRLKIINGVKAGKIKYLAATEVAARGLHIDNLDLVINYDLPTESESYVHRIGRTARAGKCGKAITFACEKYVYGLESIEALTNMKIPVVWADDDLFLDDKSADMRFPLEKNGLGLDRNPKKRSRPGRSLTKESTRPRSSSAGSAAKPKQKKAGPVTQQSKFRKQQKANSTTLASLSPDHPGRHSSIEERMDYYRKKYGESFEVVPQKEGSENNHPSEPTKRTSLLRKLLKFMGVL